MQTIGDMYANASEKAERSVKSRLSCGEPGGVPGGGAEAPDGPGAVPGAPGAPSGAPSRAAPAARAPAPVAGGEASIIESVSLQLSGNVRSVGDPLRRFHAPDRFGVSSAAQLA
jgi:hypothetical protein